MSIANRSFRLPADIAEAIELMADYEHMSQNQWVVAQLTVAVHERRATEPYMTGLAKHFAGKLEQFDKP